jgi:hypothetical protein
MAAPTQRRDGRFRKIEVKVNSPQHKIEAQSGYYAERDFATPTART